MKYVVYDPADYADIEVNEAAPEPKKWTLAHRVKTLEAEILRLRAENEKLRVTLKPWANIDIELLDDKKQPTGKFAFDPWHDDQVVFSIGKERTITAGDLRAARATASRETDNG